jgi:hypothetical protein
MMLMNQQLGKFLVEIMNPPGVLVCGCGLGIRSFTKKDGWIYYIEPKTMQWELNDIWFLEMPEWGNS